MNRKRAGSDFLIAAERRPRICEWAEQTGSVSVTALAQTLKVGRNTIRNDLDRLQQEGKLVRSHGGAIAPKISAPRPPYVATQAEDLEQKSWIGRAAIDFLPDFGSVFIGAGSTVYEMVTRFPAGKNRGVATYCMGTAAYLVSNDLAEVEFPGGVIKTPSLYSDWTLSEELFERVYWDVAFMGIAAVDVQRGITAYDRPGAIVDQRIMEDSNRVIVLSDSTKLGTFCYGRVGPVTLMDLLITDTGADPGFIKELNRNGVDVLVVGRQDSDRVMHESSEGAR